MPPAGQAAKNPARENLGRDIVVRISRYNRPESIAAGDGHPLARYRCDTEGLLLNRPCIGRILFVVAHHLFLACPIRSLLRVFIKNQSRKIYKLLLLLLLVRVLFLPQRYREIFQIL